MNTIPHTIVTLEVAREHLELLAERLEEAWQRSVIQLERPNHARAWLELYFDQPNEAEIFLAAVRANPEILATATRRESPRDWQTFWRHHFHTVNIGRHLRIVPVWERETTPPDPDRKTIWLDPGLSFGTGDHFTTRFCLERIDALVPAHPTASMLDVGTGSSILAIAARLLGVPRVLGLDNDAMALEQASENLALNGLANQIDLAVADITTDPPQGSFDLVCANVYTTVLIAIASALTACANRHLVLSGIRDPELEEVATVYRALGWEEIFRDGDGEWGGLAFRR